MELFKTPADALLFAMRFSSEQYAESAMAKSMKGPSTSSGKGLVALDGAGQAGMILSRLDRLEQFGPTGPLLRACTVARYSNRVQPCPCCGSDVTTPEYKVAILALANWASEHVSSRNPVQRLLYAIVQDYFERTRSITATAKSIGVPPRTALDQKNKIWPLLSALDKDAQATIGDILADVCGEQAD